MLQQLTNKIKKIIPEIEIEVFAGNKEMRSSMINVKTRPITLEDILRVLLLKYGAEFSIKIDGDGELFVGTKSCGLFDICKPLHEQSKKTIKELNKLI